MHIIPEQNFCFCQCVVIFNNHVEGPLGTNRGLSVTSIPMQYFINDELNTASQKKTRMILLIFVILPCVYACDFGGNGGCACILDTTSGDPCSWCVYNPADVAGGSCTRQSSCTSGGGVPYNDDGDPGNCPPPIHDSCSPLSCWDCVADAQCNYCSYGGFEVCVPALPPSAPSGHRSSCSVVICPPSPSPTQIPSVSPTISPSPAPSLSPTKLPSSSPSSSPSRSPSSPTTSASSSAPTSSPSSSPPSSASEADSIPIRHEEKDLTDDRTLTYIIIVVLGFLVAIFCIGCFVLLCLMVTRTSPAVVDSKNNVTFKPSRENVNLNDYLSARSFRSSDFEGVGTELGRLNSSPEKYHSIPSSPASQRETSSVRSLLTAGSDGSSVIYDGLGAFGSDTGGSDNAYINMAISPRENEYGFAPRFAT